MALIDIYLEYLFLYIYKKCIYIGTLFYGNLIVELWRHHCDSFYPSLILLFLFMRRDSPVYGVIDRLA